MTDLWRAATPATVSEEEYHRRRANDLERELVQAREEARARVPRAVVAAHAQRADAESARANEAQQDAYAADDRASCVVFLFVAFLLAFGLLVLAVALAVNHGVPGPG